MTENDEGREFLQGRRTRRNLMAMGTIASAALLARTKAGSARPGDGDDHKHCFLKGTNIQTIRGERKVEDLAVDDMVPTLLGGMRPIQWIGRYQFKKSDPQKSWVRDVQPVRVARSALAAGTPHTDLFLTQAHALCIDGALVPVGSLINGTTIALHVAEEFDELTFFHIKLESHDVIYAEGAPCETLLMVDEKANNFADYIRSYGAPRGEEQACLPMLSYNGARSEMMSRFRSAISPWFDRRQQIDVIRDRLEERALAAGRQAQEVS
jgi:hypothetical protein